MYCSVWLIPRYGTPSSASAAIIGALKCSAQFGVRAAGRGRHRGERLADVLGPRRVDPGRDAAEAVVVVPGDQVLDVVAAAADLVGDEVRGHDLAQVAEVDRPRRG